MEEIQNNNPGRKEQLVWLPYSCNRRIRHIPQRMGLPLPNGFFLANVVDYWNLMGFIHGFRGPAWLILIIVGGFFI
jgi:hypothetical protein